jgi:predicted metal-dependent peptidase
MGTKELEKCLIETKGILRATGAPVEFIAADTKVQAMKPVRRISDIKKLLVGGGGTDFRPVFKMFAKRSSNKPDIVIFMTDGYGPAPSKAPVGVTVIWLLMGSWGCTKPASWGEAIEVKNLKAA